MSASHPDHLPEDAHTPGLPPGLLAGLAEGEQATPPPDGWDRIRPTLHRHPRGGRSPWMWVWGTLVMLVTVFTIGYFLDRPVGAPEGVITGQEDVEAPMGVATGRRPMDTRSTLPTATGPTSRTDEQAIVPTSTVAADVTPGTRTAPASTDPSVRGGSSKMATPANSLAKSFSTTFPNDLSIDQEVESGRERETAQNDRSAASVRGARRRSVGMTIPATAAAAPSTRRTPRGGDGERRKAVPASSTAMANVEGASGASGRPQEGRMGQSGQPSETAPITLVSEGNPSINQTEETVRLPASRYRSEGETMAEAPTRRAGGGFLTADIEIDTLMALADSAGRLYPAEAERIPGLEPRVWQRRLAFGVGSAARQIRLLSAEEGLSLSPDQRSAALELWLAGALERRISSHVYALAQVGFGYRHDRLTLERTSPRPESRLSAGANALDLVLTPVEPSRHTDRHSLSQMEGLLTLGLGVILSPWLALEAGPSLGLLSPVSGVAKTRQESTTYIGMMGQLRITPVANRPTGAMSLWPDILIGWRGPLRGRQLIDLPVGAPIEARYTAFNLGLAWRW